MRTDWAAVPAPLQDRADRSVPVLCFRVAEAEGPLGVTVRRHDVADALRLRVVRADLATVFSAGGASLTAVDLGIEVLEKSSLSVRLPAGARLFSTCVNGQSVSVVREGDAYLFHVSANSDADSTAAVRLVYSATGAGPGGVSLAGPRLSVPLENVTWRVVIPPGFDLGRYTGTLRLRGERTEGPFGIREYKALVLSRKATDERNAVTMLEQANSFLQSGDQQRAGEMLEPRVERAGARRGLQRGRPGSAAQPEDRSRPVLGLNTRRQRLYLDNRADASRNEQLEQAASLNPFIQGKVNFDPQQVDQLLMGNTVEENSSLRGIASRLVDQQLAAGARAQRDRRDPSCGAAASSRSPAACRWMAARRWSSRSACARPAAPVRLPDRSSSWPSPASRRSPSRAGGPESARIFVEAAGRREHRALLCPACPRIRRAMPRRKAPGGVPFFTPSCA